jgi:protein SSD1
MSPGSGATFGSVQHPMGQFGGISGLNLGLDGQTQGVPRGHGRRHSVNVVNKTASQPNLGSLAFDGFEDGFGVSAVPLGGHSRQASRVDSSWRISKQIRTR